ncbi:MAG: aminotransferase class I/II-fold pyridoxal phosphate-dependent enzyme, partial [Prolixibacteraceae bacterium]|nr:aminotransferase class I/II-fold pyridoxal phosphate-dependent enzyme [Prolixibacteraceae bacterium]
MNKSTISRRNFIEKASIGTATVMASVPVFGFYKREADELAIFGGQPVRTQGWHGWPVWDKEAEEEIVSVLRSGIWCRLGGSKVSEFEEQYAELMGAKRCVATASGTTALLVAMHALGIDAGDEILVSPYTFIATYNVVFNSKALPVFVDTDQETF